jgi:hypothetical protein
MSDPREPVAVSVGGGGRAEGENGIRFKLAKRAEGRNEPVKPSLSQMLLRNCSLLYIRLKTFSGVIGNLQSKGMGIYWTSLFQEEEDPKGDMGRRRAYFVSNASSGKSGVSAVVAGW